MAAIVPVMCEHCGGVKDHVCSNCAFSFGKDGPDGSWKFCPGCGKKLEAVASDKPIWAQLPLLGE